MVTLNKIVFFGGKGGVGKTTCSAAYAYHCAREDKKTLLVSTDPAHSLADIFEINIGPEVGEIMKNLFALEIDPEEESQKYITAIKANMVKVVSPVIVSEIEKQLDAASVSPGSEEAALFDKLVEIINIHSAEYDRIVIDTAPTGHTLRLLSLPELLGAWLDKLIQKRKKALQLKEMSRLESTCNYSEDPVINILQQRKDKLETAREALIDSKRVSFVFVLNAEKLPIEETKKAISVLEKYKIPVNKIIVNRVLPETVSDEFWKARKDMENRYLKEIEEYFENKKIIKLPLLSSDIRANNIKDMACFF